MLQVSVWDSVEHSAQLNHLKEMVVVARGEMEAVGVTFTVGSLIGGGHADVP